MKHFAIFLSLVILFVSASCSRANNDPRVYQKQCEQKQASACQIVALKEENIGNLTEARKYHGLACEYGEKHLCCSEAGKLEAKAGNIKKARRFFQLACERAILGCYSLGTFEKEQGNTKLAEQIYRTNCDKGGVFSCLGLVMLQDRVSEKDVEFSKVTALLKTACEKGAALGCFNYANEIKNKGQITEVKNYYARACEMGEMQGCLSHGLFEEQRGNKEKAKRLYKIGCEKGDKTSCNFLKKLG